MKNIASMRSRDQERTSASPWGSPRGEVGEIDTRAPFQSVKAAVSLFGDVAVSRDKPSSVRKSRLSSENIREKETELLLAQREVDKYKQKLESAEASRAKVSSDLETAKKTLNELNGKLRIVNESKQAAVDATEVVKEQAKHLEDGKSHKESGRVDQKKELDHAREQYLAIASKLDVAKQELNKMRQDFDASLEAKSSAFQRAAEAQRSVNTNTQRVAELSKEIRAMKESYQQLKIASKESQDMQVSASKEHEARVQAYKTGKEEARKKLELLKHEYDPEMSKNLEEKLEAATKEIESLQQEMKRKHAFEMESVKVITNELNEATKTLQKVGEEESSLRNTVTLYRLELENMKKERIELEENETNAQIERLSAETDRARRQAEQMMKTVEELKRKAENARLVAAETEGKLEHVLAEANDAHAAEKRACDDIKVLSDNTRSQDHDSDNKKIRTSLEEYESLKRIEEECKKEGETTMGIAMDQVETINARTIEAQKRIEANLKAIEEIKEATDMALKSAEMAAAAQNVVEGELRRWREKEENL